MILMRRRGNNRERISLYNILTLYNMETKLLYVNKGSAYVRNNDTGDFISEVQSTICKAGDLVSIEGVAISTKGKSTEQFDVYCEDY